MATWHGQATPVAIFAGEPGGTIRPDALVPLPFLPSEVVSGDTIEFVDAAPAPVGNVWPGEVAEQSSGAFDWFEAFHVLPRSIDLGNVLSTQIVEIEIFNAFRRLDGQWTAFVSGAGLGTDLVPTPSLPTLIPALSGIVIELEVSTNGEAFVDATLDFTFGDAGTISVPIELQRIVLFGVPPELPYRETLSFLTDVHRSKSGSERRLSLRKNPRQGWGYEYLLGDDSDRRLLEHMLFDFQALTFGVPHWFEDSELTVAAVAGDATVNVTGTAFRDIRVGGLMAIISSQVTFDVLIVASFTSTSITFESALLNSYPVGTLLFPLRACNANSTISGERWAVGLRRLSINFTARDNDSNLGDLSGLPSYKGKLLLDLGNSLFEGLPSNSFRQQITRLDGGVGVPYQSSSWSRNKPGRSILVRADGREAIWTLRRALHAIRGRQVSFYAPTDSEDLVPVATLASGSDALVIGNVGYARFVRQRAPWNEIRVTLVDGTQLSRTVIASTELSASQEQLQVDANWPSAIPAASVARIEYVEKVRLDTDDVEIQFDASGHRARVRLPAEAVFE